MTEDDLRAAMKKRFEAMSMREWCRLTGCQNSHVSDFVAGKRGPPADLLRALNMRVDYVKCRRQPFQNVPRQDAECDRRALSEISPFHSQPDSAERQRDHADQ